MENENKNNEQVSEMEPAFSAIKKGLYGMINVKKLEEKINSNTIKWTRCSKVTGENKLPKYFFEKCYNILNCIIESKEGSVSRNMFAKVDSNYTDFIAFLTDIELMECTDSGYSVFKHISKKYKVNENILNLRKQEIKDTRILEFKKKMEDKKLKEFRKYNNVDDVKIGLSKSYVYKALQNHFADKAEPERSQNIKMAYGDYCKINDGMIYGCIANDSRLHSNFTRIPKCIRRLTYQNEELVEFDIHATHIFLLPKTIENMLRQEEVKKAAGINHLSEKRIQNIRNDITKFTDMLESCFDNNVDVYSEFAKQYGMDVSRDDIKVNLLSWINNETGFGYEKIDQMFDLLFPYIKQYMKDKKSGRFNLFNFEMTRLETGLILPICEEVVKSGLTLISVHDCLMFRAKDKDTVFKIITEHMEKKECTLLTWKEKTFIHNLSLISDSQAHHLATLDTDNNFSVVDNEKIDTKNNYTHSSSPHILCLNSINHDTKNENITTERSLSGAIIKKITQNQVRLVANNGSTAWEYRGTGKQRLKVSCRKKTIKEFVDMVNEKFISGEWVTSSVPGVIETQNESVEIMDSEESFINSVRNDVNFRKTYPVRFGLDDNNK